MRPGKRLGKGKVCNAPLSDEIDHGQTAASHTMMQGCSSGYTKQGTERVLVSRDLEAVQLSNDISYPSRTLIFIIAIDQAAGAHRFS